MNIVGVISFTYAESTYMYVQMYGDRCNEANTNNYTHWMDHEDETSSLKLKNNNHDLLIWKTLNSSSFCKMFHIIKPLMCLTTFYTAKPKSGPAVAAQPPMGLIGGPPNI